MRIQVILGLVLALPFSAAAQGPGGVSNSGMGQGEARISSRSDVRLSLESVPGTSGASMSALGARISPRMRAIRTCYDATVSENPGIAGTLRLRVLIEETGRANIEVDNDGINDRTLVRCISLALGELDCNGLRRPTHAIVQLELSNSASSGAARAAERAQIARQVAVTMDSEGNATTNGGTPDGHVRFTTIGAGRSAGPAVTAAHRTLLEALPGLMDCRRRAGRRGQNQEGEISVTMRVRRNRPLQSVVNRSTVEDERARSCVRRVLQRQRRRAEAGSGAVRVRVSFAADAPGGG